MFISKDSTGKVELWNEFPIKLTVKDTYVFGSLNQESGVEVTNINALRNYLEVGEVRTINL